MTNAERPPASWDGALAPLFPPEVVALITDGSTVVRIPRGGSILRRGDVSDSVYVLVRGAMRMVYLRRGREHIGDFFLEGDLVAEYTSFVTGRPTRFDIVATEACELRAIQPSSLARAQALYPLAMERGLRLVAEGQAVTFAARIWATLMDPPAVRYRTLLAEHPVWFDRFPLYMIASYLGITPEGLSKLRRRVGV